MTKCVIPLTLSKMPPSMGHKGTGKWWEWWDSVTRTNTRDVRPHQTRYEWDVTAAEGQMEEWPNEMMTHLMSLVCKCRSWSYSATQRQKDRTKQDRVSSCCKDNKQSVDRNNMHKKRGVFQGAVRWQMWRIERKIMFQGTGDERHSTDKNKRWSCSEMLQTIDMLHRQEQRGGSGPEAL